MAKIEKETQKKLDKLSKVMKLKNNENSKKENSKQKKRKQDSNLVFKTSEVVILLVITTILSLFLGSIITNKVLNLKITKVSDNLQEFISNYEYIISNYNGNIDEEELLNSALEAVLNKLDKNSTYIDSEENSNFDKLLEGSYTGYGIQITNDDNDNIVVYSVFKNSPADDAGIKAGDILVKYNNEDIKGLTSSELIKKITDNNKKSIKLTYKRNDEEITVKLKTATIELKSVSSDTYNENNKKIGYIYVSIFANNTATQFSKQLSKLEKKEIDSLIIDLRSNSGGYLQTATTMISEFLDKTHPIYQIQKNNKITKYYSVGAKTKKYKIIVLVNENSASAAEIMASALQEQYGATLIGTKTYGKGTVQELQKLRSGNEYKVTTKNWLTSNGKWIDETGIEPDIEIELNSSYLDEPSTSNDNQLQKAIKEASK